MWDAGSGEIAEPLASRSVPRHLARGVVGFGAIALAIWIGMAANAWWQIPSALGLAVIAIVAFRGCPTCWLVGLVATCRGTCRR